MMLPVLSILTQLCHLSLFIVLGIWRKQYLLVAVGFKPGSDNSRISFSAGFQLKRAVIAFILNHPFPLGSFSTYSAISLNSTDLFLTSHYPGFFAFSHWLQVLEIINRERLTETCLAYTAACHPHLLCCITFSWAGQNVYHAYLACCSRNSTYQMNPKAGAGYHSIMLLHVCETKIALISNCNAKLKFVVQALFQYCTVLFFRFFLPIRMLLLNFS